MYLYPIPSLRKIGGYLFGYLRLLWAPLRSFSCSESTPVPFLWPSHFMLPVAVVAQMLKARFESYMFVHPEDRSSDINYWRNVFMVKPLLTLDPSTCTRTTY